MNKSPFIIILSLLLLSLLLTILLLLSYYHYYYIIIIICLFDCLTFPPLLQLYIDLRPKHAIPKWCTGSYGKKLRRRAWLTIWDEVKSHGTVIDWCTRREWPVNCMTVISAWWRSNMPFQRYWVGDWTII